LGTDNHEQEVALGLLENEGQMLEQTAAALARIEQGTYGRCVDCQKDIPAERLRAIPYTPRCFECARRLESEGTGGAPTESST
jgi:RNA polymerase-binding transcription factor DksA